VRDRPIDALLANAGRRLGDAFLDQDFEEVRRVIDTNVTGTIYLIQKVGREMKARGRGRILITGSIAGFMAGTYQAVYNGTKAFLDLFSYAIRAELAGSGVTVTCLMPGATETEFFERADMLDTKVGAEKKDDPADVAERGFKAMMDGEGGVIIGWQNKLQVAISRMAPPSFSAKCTRSRRLRGLTRMSDRPAGQNASEILIDTLIDGVDRSHELGAGGEGKVLAAPEAKPLGVGKIVHGGRTRSRHVDDTRIGQRMLEPQSGPALLRGCLLTALALAASGIRHGMAFVEHDHSVEVRSQPIDDLPDPRNPFLARVGT